MILGMRTVTYHTPDLAAGKAFYSAFVGHEPYFDELFYVGFVVAGFELGLMPDSKTGSGPGGTTFYWGTDDLDVEVVRVVGLGRRSRTRSRTSAAASARSNSTTPSVTCWA